MVNSNHMVISDRFPVIRHFVFDLEQMGMKLNREPFKPTYLIFLRDFSGFLSDEWIPYLHPAFRDPKSVINYIMRSVNTVNI